MGLGVSANYALGVLAGSLCRDNANDEPVVVDLLVLVLLEATGLGEDLLGDLGGGLDR